jgi:hypothetical protein
MTTAGVAVEAGKAVASITGMVASMVDVPGIWLGRIVSTAGGEISGAEIPPKSEKNLGKKIKLATIRPNRGLVRIKFFISLNLVAKDVFPTVTILMPISNPAMIITSNRKLFEQSGKIP